MAERKKLRKIVDLLKQHYPLTQAEVLQILKQKEKEEKEQQACFIPLSLFTAVPVSSLEAITLYLREEKKLKFSVMAAILGRNEIALSTSYRNAHKKYSSGLKISEGKYYIPATIFRNRTCSVLETIVLYLKKEYLLHNVKIAELLGKDPRTIWTVVQRIKNKGVKL